MKLVRTDNQTTGTESESKIFTMGTHQNGTTIHRYNSLLDPNLAVYDLDTMEINQNIFDDSGS